MGLKRYFWHPKQSILNLSLPFKEALLLRAVILKTSRLCWVSKYLQHSLQWKLISQWPLKCLAKFFFKDNAPHTGHSFFAGVEVAVGACEDKLSSDRGSNTAEDRLSSNSGGRLPEEQAAHQILT